MALTAKEKKASEELAKSLFEIYGKKAVDEFLDLNKKLPPFHKWVTKINVDGHPFKYEGREYLKLPYKDNHPWQVKQKATQVAGTTEEMLRATYALVNQERRGVLYYFPSKTEVTKFSKGRMGPLIKENPAYIDKFIKNTDDAHIKQIGSGFLYLLGMGTALAVKSVPGSMLIFDEFDEAPQDNFDKAMERIGGVLEGEQESPVVRLISNPSFPDFGVTKLFGETDQRYWCLKCPKCNHFNCLEDAFMEWAEGKKSGPAPILELRDGRTIRACIKCRTELDPKIGKWIAKKPKIKDKRGYHYTQLWSQTIMHSPEMILQKYYTALEKGNLQDFYNLTIGIGYVDAENRLSEEEVYSMCGDRPIASESKESCFMGVDQGKDLYVVISKKHQSKAGEIVHLGIYRDWEELERLMRNFNVSMCVVDALPETRNARAFAEAHKGRVFLCYYNEHQKGSYAWNEKEFIVQCNRTESMDASHKEVADQRLIVPRRNEMVETFAQHLHNVARKLVEEEELDRKTGLKRKTGTKRYVYVQLGPDHFRHAFNYECMARQSGRSLLFPEFA